MTMTADYLEHLADKADPDQLWRLPGMEQLDLPSEKREQLDTGVALRRYASRIRQLDAALAEGRSLLITPLSLSSAGAATKSVPTPADHAKLRRGRA